MTGTTGRQTGRSPGGHLFSARDLALVAVFAGVMAALGLVPAWTPPGFTVPITAQSMGVMLAGGVLGGRRGALSMLAFLALVAIGLPLLAGGRGGLGVFAGPSVGFLVGFPVAAYVVGVLSERMRGTASSAGRLAAGLVANVVGGVLVLYVFGVLGMAVNLRIPIDEATTLLESSADALDWLAFHVVWLGFDCEILDPPELRDAAVDLAGRLRRAVPTA
jgi:biotin transport system substrate-specific component